MGDWNSIWQTDHARQLWTEPDRRVKDLVVAWKAAGNIHRVLDVGCGIGRHACLLAAEGFDVYGLDPSSAALRSCEERLQSHHLAARLSCGAVTDLDVPPGFFDAAIAFNSLYHGFRRDLQTSIDAIHRLLRDEGVCFVTVPSRQNRLYGKGVQLEPHTFASPGMFRGVIGDSGEIDVPHYYASDFCSSPCGQDELVAFCQERLSAHKIPRVIEVRSMSEL